MKLEWVSVMAFDWETHHGWEHYDRAKHEASQKPCPIGGILVDRTDKWLTVAVGYNPTAGDWLGVVTIPVACVLSISVLATEEV